jgi:uncharacterized protein
VLGMAAKFEISKVKAGKFRFHLKVPNGEIIAASQGYESKANAEKGVEAIKTHAPGAKVEDHSRHGLGHNSRPGRSRNACAVRRLGNAGAHTAGRYPRLH